MSGTSPLLVWFDKHVLILPLKDEGLTTTGG